MVFEGFQFGGDVTLGVFEGLPPLVVIGHFIGLTACDLNIKPMHAIKFHAQIGNAGAGALAQLDVGQQAAGIGLQTTQCVELCVVACANDPPIAQLHRRLIGEYGL